MSTFAAMKKQKKSLLKILFFFFVITSLGRDAKACSVWQPPEFLI